MQDLAWRKKVAGSMDEILPKITEELKHAGFGVLTRIDFDQKIQEKLGEKLPQTVILGACNPRLAFEGFRRNTDIACLVPCNVVVRDLEDGSCQVEIVKPSALLSALGDQELTQLAASADASLQKAWENL